MRFNQRPPLRRRTRRQGIPNKSVSVPLESRDDRIGLGETKGFLMSALTRIEEAQTKGGIFKMNDPLASLSLRMRSL